MKKLLSYAVLFLAALLPASLGAFWLAVRPPRFAVPGRPRDYGLPAAEFAFTERGRHGEIGRDLEGRIVDFFRRRLGPRG